MYGINKPIFPILFSALVLVSYMKLISFSKFPIFKTSFELNPEMTSEYGYVDSFCEIDI